MPWFEVNILVTHWRGQGRESGNCLSRAQMVPSGGLLRAKMAPAGTQMGFSNLINARIVDTVDRNTRRQNSHTHKTMCILVQAPTQ